VVGQVVYFQKRADLNNDFACKFLDQGRYWLATLQAISRTKNICAKIAK
jgi:hypothetical protein